MKIRLLSDLHLETHRHSKDRSLFHLKGMDKERKQILCLLGDIDTKLNMVSFIKRIHKRFKAVIIVAGNHEFYNQEVIYLYSELKKQLEMMENVYFLQDDKVIIDDVVFIGSTLWSDFDSHNNNLMKDCKDRIGDFYEIKYKEKRITPSVMYDLNKYSREYINHILNEYSDKKKVVLTHFCPDESLSDYKTSLSRYFCNTGLEFIIEKADYWLFGHTHESVEKELHGCMCISNPIGYKGNEVKGGDILKVIEIK